MGNTTTIQLDEIQSMLAAGHRNIRLEKHTLVLWGMAGGALCAFTDLVITHQRFPIPWVRAVALLVFLAIVLSGVAVVDFNYTRYRVRARDETFSFAQKQVTKIWWLLVGMGVLFTFAVSFFGGGYMVFGVWLVLFGLGLYIHGLFSEQILEWIGVIMIVLGVVALSMNIPYPATQWLAASVFGLGMPLLSTMLDRGQTKPIGSRLLQSGIWLVFVLGFALILFQWIRNPALPDGPATALQSFMHQSVVLPTQIVTIPAGNKVPLKIRFSGNVVSDGDATTSWMTLTRPLDVSLREGKPDGRFRVGQGDWQQRDVNLKIRVLELTSEINPREGPSVSMSINLSTDY
jgi:hypothetical protein